MSTLAIEEMRTQVREFAKMLEELAPLYKQIADSKNAMMVAEFYDISKAVEAVWNRKVREATAKRMDRDWAEWRDSQGVIDTTSLRRGYNGPASSPAPEPPPVPPR